MGNCDCKNKCQERCQADDDPFVWRHDLEATGGVKEVVHFGPMPAMAAPIPASKGGLDVDDGQRAFSFQSAPTEARIKPRPDDKTPEFGKERNADERVIVKGVAPPPTGKENAFKGGAPPPTGKENAFKYFPAKSAPSKPPNSTKCNTCQSPGKSRPESKALSQRELLERNWVDLRDPPSIRYLPASASPFKGLDVSPFRRIAS
jgi:hypothetical protein